MVMIMLSILSREWIWLLMKIIHLSRQLCRIDMNNVDFVLDFGSNPDNTEVTVSNIILKESSCNE